MHRNSRIIVTACNKRCCRSFGTAYQLKVKPEIKASSSEIPPARSWARSPPVPQQSVQASARNPPASSNDSLWASGTQTPSSSQAFLEGRPGDVTLPARNWPRPSDSSPSSSQQLHQVNTRETSLPARTWTHPSRPASSPPSQDTPLPARNWARPSPPTSTTPSRQSPSQLTATDRPARSKTWTRPPSLGSLQHVSVQTTTTDTHLPARNWMRPSTSTSPTSQKQVQSATNITENNLSVRNLGHPSASASRVSPPLRQRDGVPRQSSVDPQYAVPGRQTNQTMQPKVSTPKLVNSTISRQETSRIPPKLLIKKSKPRSKNARRKNVYIPTTLTVATLSKLLKVKLDFLLSKMRQVGMTQEATYDYILTSDYAMLLADELGYNPIIDDDAAFDIHAPPPHPNPSSLPPRPPIVTIMGHVDHGKTTLLDTLRSAAVAKGEAGGITQHIGAFSVPVSQNANSTTGSETITFLDTPGHAAFSAMRARGADVTDIVVLVVAADDGIMPQTKEVINLLKREGSHVSLVVAINKVDKPGADVESVKQALMVEGIQLEEFGGDTPSVEVSGLTGHGLPELVETLSAVAEMQDLRAEQDGPVFGHILESNFNKGIGPVATVLVQRGCLKVGTRVISGLSQGKVRLMTDSNGKSVKVAIPGMAVTVSGWKTLPKAGDEILEGSEADIKKALANRVTMAEKEALHEDVEAINSSRKLDRDARAAAAAAEAESRHLARDTTPTESETGPKELKLIIKADVSGSSEALEGALDSIGNSIAISKVMSTGVGDITESDVMMAKVANAIIVGFSVSTPRIVQNLAAQNGVPVFTSNIIYRLVEDIRERVISMLPKIVETKVVGEATVLQIFEIQLKSKQMAKVAGCRVTNGNVEKQKYARVVRDGEIVYEGSLDTMRHLKKEITEARKGMECGLSLKDFSDLREGDMIQMYEKIEKPGIL